ncbi:hypothetical protein SB6413_04561 [Klebsiella pasteurii]|nr:hypothetical protein SB6413_04561 [Klebsiella pasteurii]
MSNQLNRMILNGMAITSLDARLPHNPKTTNSWPAILDSNYSVNMGVYIYQISFRLNISSKRFC